MADEPTVFSADSSAIHFAEGHGSIGKKGIIHNAKFPLKDLFGSWARDLNDPHADFQLDSTCFYLVDYDGDGCMSYVLTNDTLVVNYGDYKEVSIISRVDKDSLFFVSERGLETSYVRWLQ